MAEKANILLVDDRPENIVALEAILSSLNQTLVAARSGDAALKALLRDEFAVILLDVLMPGMDGFETAARIKRRPRTRDVPIIFLTALNTEPDFAFRSYSAGAVDYIAKPFDPWVLRAKVSVFVDLYMKNRQLSEQAALLRARLAACFPGRRPPPRTTTSRSPCTSWSTAWDGYATWSTHCGPTADAVTLTRRAIFHRCLTVDAAREGKLPGGSKPGRFNVPLEENRHGRCGGSHGGVRPRAPGGGPGDAVCQQRASSCAIVGLDTLGQVSSYGAQTFTWVIILAVAFLFPYALVIAELGSAFTQEGGPYEWMKLAWGRLVAGSGRGRRCRGRSGAGGRRGRRPGRGRCRRRRRG